MKQYKLQELVGNTKKLPRSEKYFYETLINFRKLPECAQLFLPLQIHSHIKARRREHSIVSNGRNAYQNSSGLQRRCSEEEEEVQSYLEWKVFLSWIKLSSWRNFRRLRKTFVYILPVGPFPGEMLSSLVSPQLSFLQALVNFGEAFFAGISFKILPVIEYKEIGCKTRIHHRTGQLQLFLPDLMQYLTTVMPKNAVGIVAISWVDFYPDENLNSILGEGSVQSGCAAISFGHYGQNILAPGPQGFTLNKGQELRSTSQITASEQITCSLPDRDNQHGRASTHDFIENRFAKSLLNESSRRKATSTRSINMNRLSFASNISLDHGLSHSAGSYKHLGSLSSIENSWTKVFSRSVESLCSSSSIDDESYDIINRDEAGSSILNHGIEEDIVKLALPIGCEFKMNCSTMWRLFKALAHEVCHIFGLSHCNFYECVMNCSNQISEVDEQPIFLCPVCLRKLQKFLRFKLINRYWRLAEVWSNMQPCYSENISISRNEFLRELAQEESQNFADNDLDDCVRGHRRRESCDAAGHICIEVTRERNEGYDIINVEYKNARETWGNQHDCRLAEARDKLENIISFLNRS